MSALYGHKYVDTCITVVGINTLLQQSVRKILEPVTYVSEDTDVEWTGVAAGDTSVNPKGVGPS